MPRPGSCPDSLRSASVGARDRSRGSSWSRTDAPTAGGSPSTGRCWAPRSRAPRSRHVGGSDRPWMDRGPVCGSCHPFAGGFLGGTCCVSRNRRAETAPSSPPLIRAAHAGHERARARVAGSGGCMRGRNRGHELTRSGGCMRGRHRGHDLAGIPGDACVAGTGVVAWGRIRDMSGTSRGHERPRIRPHLDSNRTLVLVRDDR